MENLVKLLILGFIQGLTEFLPVSSSGHLVIFTDIFQFRGNQLSWTIAFHTGTLLSIICYFRKDLKKILFSFMPFNRVEKEERKHLHWLVYLLFLGTLPAAAIGLLFYDFFERVFQNVYLVVLTLFINGCWLIFAEWMSSKKKVKIELKDLNWKQALWIGIGQMVALTPGISRSGATIGCGYLCGLKKESAFNFAFLLALPAIFGALLLSLGEMKGPLITLTIVVLFTAFVGYLALKILAQLVKKSKLKYFAFYCWVLSFWTLFYMLRI